MRTSSTHCCKIRLGDHLIVSSGLLPHILPRQALSTIVTIVMDEDKQEENSVNFACARKETNSNHRCACASACVLILIFFSSNSNGRLLAMSKMWPA
jgi:hypothetical protein